MAILLTMIIAQPLIAAPKKDKKGKKESSSINASLAADEIRLVVSGEGQTKDEAIQNALRNAIEQNYGVFVSSSSSIMNDELVKDEIATVASGNVRNYNILRETETDGIHRVTLDAIISVGKLISYVKSKGGATELDGQTFAMNLKLHGIKEANTRMAIDHLIEEIAEMMTNCYDYTIDVSEPVGNYGMAIVNVKVTASLNQNFYNAMSYARKTMEALSVPIEEVKAEANLGNIAYSYWGDKYGHLSLNQRDLFEESNPYGYIGEIYGSGNDRRFVSKSDLKDIYFGWGGSLSPEGAVPSNRIAQIFNFVVSDGTKEYYPFVLEDYENYQNIDWYWTIAQADKELSQFDFDRDRLTEVRTQYGESNQSRGRKILRYETKVFNFVLKYTLEEIASVKGITVEPLNGRKRPPIFWEVKGIGSKKRLEPLENQY